MSQASPLPLFLCLGGYPEHGKSSFADAISNSDTNVVRISFGGPAKAKVIASNAFVRKMFDAHGERAKKDPDVRKAFQEEGLHAGEYYGEEVFAGIQIPRIVEALRAGQHVIADDCRRVPEFVLGTTMKKIGVQASYGFLNYRIVDPRKPTPEHPMERKLDGLGDVIENGGTLEEWRSFAVRFWETAKVALDKIHRQEERLRRDPLALLELSSSNPRKALEIIAGMLR